MQRGTLLVVSYLLFQVSSSVLQHLDCSQVASPHNAVGRAVSLPVCDR